MPAASGASARDLGLICPASQGGEAAWAGRVEVLAAPDLLALMNHFRGTQVLTPPEPPAPEAAAPRGPCLSEVKGQESAKRALEVAAAGGHNLFELGTQEPKLRAIRPAFRVGMSRPCPAFTTNGPNPSTANPPASA